MSDLISRQEVIDLMYEVFEKYSVATDKQDELCGFGTEMFRRIKELPIAFDKEKVIKETNKNLSKLLHICALEDADKVYDFYDSLEESIRKGGVE